MKARLILVVALMLTACATPARTQLQKGFSPQQITQQTKEKAVEEPIDAKPTQPAYPDLGVAPELTNQVWLNTSQPLRLADLRGKVVLIDMWTFG